MGLTLSEFLPYRLNCLSEAMSQEIKPIYRDHFGLNRPEWRVLVALADLGTATAKDVGAHSAQHKTRISRAVRALEQRRWLTRESDPKDRRSEMLTLTAAGHRAYCDLVGPMRAQEAGILDRLSPEDRAALGTALSALENALGLSVAQPPE
ncbi:MarR family winged helix-turn-helix transcriptional regulator [Sedimentitalea todarodis]|uniref:MarR family winged helix-turn-helix transcriptional regulator n=1 Tax=Sedimentitalea todarodis TaxID=1631240 RepID=A0ABU3V9W7_9RHOB|nr:MarR family winged helix-turn-helix transcriptional regulator [Sedimentitalea todarodis]MDU9002963.1 MarR family winged helix-turn-helix transcriptional regulator [Sedimentitalea todarodis]